MSYTSTQKCELEKQNNKQIIIKITKSERINTELQLESENENVEVTKTLVQRRQLSSLQLTLVFLY